MIVINAWIMKSNVDFEIIRMEIHELVDVQERGNWNKICADFKVENMEDVYRLFSVAEGLKNKVQIFCRSIKLPIQHFRDFYVYLSYRYSDS